MEEIIEGDKFVVYHEGKKINFPNFLAEHWFDYDAKGREIYHRYAENSENNDFTEYRVKFNERGNIDSIKFNDDYEDVSFAYEYDTNGNVIFSFSPTGLYYRDGNTHIGLTERHLKQNMEFPTSRLGFTEKSMSKS